MLGWDKRFRGLSFIRQYSGLGSDGLLVYPSVWASCGQKPGVKGTLEQS